MRELSYNALSQDELGCISPPTSGFPFALEISFGFCPQDISRASRNFLVIGDVQTIRSLLSAVYRCTKGVQGKSRGRRGWISQYLPSFREVRTFSSSSIHLQGWICGHGRIDSVKINPSLLRMRECPMLCYLPSDLMRCLTPLQSFPLRHCWISSM